MGYGWRGYSIVAGDQCEGIGKGIGKGAFGIRLLEVSYLLLHSHSLSKPDELKRTPFQNFQHVTNDHTFCFGFVFAWRQPSYVPPFVHVLKQSFHLGRDGSFVCTVAAWEVVIALKCRYWAYLSQRERLALPLGVLALGRSHATNGGFMSLCIFVQVKSWHKTRGKRIVDNFS